MEHGRRSPPAWRAVLLTAAAIPARGAGTAAVAAETTALALAGGILLLGGTLGLGLIRD